MTVTSLVMSILALCVSLGNLTWQLVLYVFNGPRVRVRMFVGGLGRGGLVIQQVEDVRNLEQTFEAFRQQGCDQPVIAIRVVNQGRLGVELLDFGIDIPKGVRFKPVKDAITETPMPYVLEPHREGTWALPFHYAMSLAKTSQATWPRESHPIGAYVIRAGGKTIRAKHRLRLAPGVESTAGTTRDATL